MVSSMREGILSVLCTISDILQHSTVSAPRWAFSNCRMECIIFWKALSPLSNQVGNGFLILWLMEHGERKKEEGGSLPPSLSVDFKARYCHMPLDDRVYKR